MQSHIYRGHPRRSRLAPSLPSSSLVTISKTLLPRPPAQLELAFDRSCTSLLALTICDQRLPDLRQTPLIQSFCSRATTMDSLKALEPTPIGIVYHDLDEHEIRVLHLHPSSEFESPICVSLHRVKFLDGPVYRALSYVWGDPTVTSPIYVDGTSFEATVNLVSALRHIRRSESVVVLWVDAVCINQKNIKERNHQVQMMARIYRSAEKVISWLGEAEKDSDEAMKLLDRWGTAIEHLGFRTTRDILAGFPFLYDTRNVLGLLARIDNPFDERGWNGISSVWKRPYWSRLWIVQEFVVSSSITILCGTQTLRPEHLNVSVWWVAMSVQIQDWDPIEAAYKNRRMRGGVGEMLTTAIQGLKRVGKTFVARKSRASFGAVRKLIDGVLINENEEMRLVDELSRLRDNSRDQQLLAWTGPAFLLHMIEDNHGHRGCSDPRDKIFAAAGFCTARLRSMWTTHKRCTMCNCRSRINTWWSSVGISSTLLA